MRSVLSSGERGGECRFVKCLNFPLKTDRAALLMPLNPFSRGRVGEEKVNAFSQGGHLQNDIIPLSEEEKASDSLVASQVKGTSNKPEKGKSPEKAYIGGRFIISRPQEVPLLFLGDESSNW